ncbi:flagellar hook-length control protein FliK [Paeniglutamicibacter psychrophenolicus]|uniref:Flagellar hook-length control protein FliK n=1 Tax=Paeniglutamicibacter psychrophenolicus TaxID=257454 RepID=A0ABS4WD40_9MICC|nr:flagellar hook-length control protein FliK [Paeniglutamicibacter psychrophenolicus]MBP2374065.1 flagellar hook-length control protein FliK [Paeniglutamicibacter psychrophenolicus]
MATGSAARASFPVAVAPLLTVPVPGAPTPETTAPPQVAPLPLAEAPLLNLRLPGAPSPETAAPPQVPPLPVAKSPLLVIEMPESVDSVAGALELADSAVDPGTPDASRTATTDTLPATSPGTASVQDAAPAAIHPGVPESGSDTAEPSIPAGDGPRAGGGPSPAAAGVALAEPVPSAAPPAPVPASATAAHSVAQAAEPGPAAATRPSNDLAVGAIDPIEVPSATAAPARTHTPPLHRQLLGPIATLAAGPNGERTLSVNIAPEALGPITVKAHLGSEGIRMDLSAPTEAGREALRAMLPELRRELAASGGGNITLNTTADGSSSGGSPRGEAFGSGGEQRAATGPRSAVSPGGTGQPPEFQAPPELPTHRATSHLDVMA